MGGEGRENGDGIASDADAIGILPVPSERTILDSGRAIFGRVSLPEMRTESPPMPLPSALKPSPPKGRFGTVLEQFRRGRGESRFLFTERAPMPMASASTPYTSGL